MKKIIDFKKDRVFLIIIGVLVCILSYGLISSFIQNMKLNAALDAELKAYKNTYNPFPPLPEEERDKHIRNIFGNFDRLESAKQVGYEYYKVFVNNKILGYAKLIEKDIA